MKNKEEILMDMIESKDFDQLSPDEIQFVIALSDETSYRQMRQLFLELSDNKIEFESSGTKILFIESTSKKHIFNFPANTWKIAAMLAIASNLFFAYNYFGQNNHIAIETNNGTTKTEYKTLHDTVYTVVYQTPSQSGDEEITPEKPSLNNLKKRKVNESIDIKVGEVLNTYEVPTELNILKSNDYMNLTASNSNRSLANDSFISGFTFATF